MNPASPSALGYSGRVARYQRALGLILWMALFAVLLFVVA